MSSSSTSTTKKRKRVGKFDQAIPSKFVFLPREVRFQIFDYVQKCLHTLSMTCTFLRMECDAYAHDIMTTKYPEFEKEYSLCDYSPSSILEVVMHLLFPISVETLNSTPKKISNRSFSCTMQTVSLFSVTCCAQEHRHSSIICSKCAVYCSKFRNVLHDLLHFISSSEKPDGVNVKIDNRLFGIWSTIIPYMTPSVIIRRWQKSQYIDKSKENIIVEIPSKKWEQSLKNIDEYITIRLGSQNPSIILELLQYYRRRSSMENIFLLIQCAFVAPFYYVSRNSKPFELYQPRVPLEIHFFNDEEMQIFHLNSDKWIYEPNGGRQESS